MPRPVIVLDESCAALREALAQLGPVFVFQRKAGFLTTPASAAAAELHQALTVGRVTPPYIMVAASFGGLAALAYAARHPATLAGLVLVDSSHPEQGVAALAAIPDGEPTPPAVEAFKNHLQGFGTVWTESCRSLAQIGDVGHVPMIVLAAGSPDLPGELSAEARRALTQSWHGLQRRHAARSTRGELRIVPGCGHNIVATAPQVIVAAVNELVAPGGNG